MAQANLGHVRLNLGDAVGAAALMLIAAPAVAAAGHYHTELVRGWLHDAQAALCAAQPEPEPA